MRPASPDLPARFLKPCLDELALLLTLKGENTFKIRAFEHGATILDETALPLGEFLQSVEAGKVKGFGKGLLEVMTQLVSRGSCDALDELRTEFPRSLIQLLDIPGLGPKKLATLHHELSIKTLADLEQACQRGEIATLKGFGEKTQIKFLEAIDELKSYQGLFRLDVAMVAAEKLERVLKQQPEVSGVHLTGALRRGAETFRELEFVVVTSNHSLKIGKHFPDIDLPLKSHLCAPDQLGLSLILTTGSAEHLLELEHYIHNSGLPALKNSQGAHDERWRGLSEAEIFARLRLAEIPAELREGRGEVRRAAELFSRDEAFPALVSLTDLKGVIHAHSTYSDGRNSLEEMALGTRERGFEYFGISDHSQSSFYAGGLSPERVRKQFEEVEQLNKQLAPFQIFRGTEADIHSDGSLDYGDLFLRSFDFVVVSVHSNFTQTREQMTERVCRAVRNPSATILGHPSGRLLLDRKPYQIDLEQVLDAAAESGIVIEINANPYRLELSWELLAAAKERGIKIAINPDAHSVSQIDYLKYGVLIARKGGLTAKDVFNTMDRASVAKYLSARRQVTE